MSDVLLHIRGEFNLFHCETWAEYGILTRQQPQTHSQKTLPDLAHLLTWISLEMHEGELNCESARGRTSITSENRWFQDPGRQVYLGEAAQMEGLFPASRARVLVQHGGVGGHTGVHQRAIGSPYCHLCARVVQDMWSAAELTAGETRTWSLNIEE